MEVCFSRQILVGVMPVIRPTLIATSARERPDFAETLTIYPDQQTSIFARFGSIRFRCARLPLQLLAPAKDEVKMTGTVRFLIQRSKHSPKGA
jgi:hypothetical protein